MYRFTKTLTDNYGSPKGTWTIQLDFAEDIKIKPNDSWWLDLCNYDKVRPYIKYSNSNGSVLPNLYIKQNFNIWMRGDSSLPIADSISMIENYPWRFECDNPDQTPKQSVFYPMHSDNQPNFENTQADLYFNENNPEDSYVEGLVILDKNGYGGDWTSKVQLETSNPAIGYEGSNTIALGTVRFYLDAPPTFSESVDTTGDIYKDLTPYQVTISNSDAKMGGNIVHSAVTIGYKTVAGTGDGTLSIIPEEPGTFTPIVEVEDSRGQVATKTLPEITVLDYQKPSIQSFELARSNSNGVVSDEGFNALLSVNYSYYIAHVKSIDAYGRVVINPTTLSKPTVKKNGTDVSNAVNWYSSISESGVSSPITFPYSLPSTGTIYGVLTTTIPYEDSAQIALTLGDSLGGQSTEITQVLPQAFYTIDFLAGGKGVAFGAPATEEKFKVAMTSEFEDIVAENVTAEGEMTDGQGNVLSNKANILAGAVQMYAGATEPEGWKFCNGQTLKKSDYPELFAAIGTTYNDGTEASTDFRVPDFKNRFPVGAGADYALNGKGGAATVTLNTNQMPAHVHGVGSNKRFPVVNSYRTLTPTSKRAYTATNANGVAYIVSTSTEGIEHWENMLSQGGDQAHENMPPYIGINYIICTGK